MNSCHSKVGLEAEALTDRAVRICVDLHEQHRELLVIHDAVAEDATEGLSELRESAVVGLPHLDPALRLGQGQRPRRPP